MGLRLPRYGLVNPAASYKLSLTSSYGYTVKQTSSYMDHVLTSKAILVHSGTQCRESGLQCCEILPVQELQREVIYDVPAHVQSGLLQWTWEVVPKLQVKR